MVALTVAAGAAAISVQTASAAPPQSTLVATPTSLPLDVGGFGNPSSGTITVQLDPSTCLNVFTAGQIYAIAATSSDLTGKTTVSPASPDTSPALQCAPAKQGAPTFATFTVNTACPATPATITFSPVAGPPGIQKKLAGTSTTVTVTDGSNFCGAPGPGPGPGGPNNPAAPAVTNGYLNANSAVVAACKLAISGPSWRGQLLSFIAHWMPRPESVKDTYFNDPNDWVLYVETEVNVACGVSKGGFLEPDGTGSQSQATFTSPPLSNYAPFSSSHP